MEQVSDAKNLHLLTLLEHRREQYLVIIDNITDTQVTAYVLDYAKQEGINPLMLIQLAKEWLEKTNGEYPLSFELSRLGLTSVTRQIYKTFDVSHVTRLVGLPFVFNLTTPLRVRRRRASKVSAGIEVRPKAAQVYEMPSASSTMRVMATLPSE